MITGAGAITGAVAAPAAGGRADAGWGAAASCGAAGAACWGVDAGRGAGAACWGARPACGGASAACGGASAACGGAGAAGMLPAHTMPKTVATASAVRVLRPRARDVRWDFERGPSEATAQIAPVRFNTV